MTSSSPPTSSDPTVIEVLIARHDDVLTAIESYNRGNKQTVLRVTPPFAVRMRARIHRILPNNDPEISLDSGEATPEPTSPINISPVAFVDSTRPIPTVDDIEDQLRHTAADYSINQHHETYQAAIESWREDVAKNLCESITFDTATQQIAANVSYLGGVQK